MFDVGPSELLVIAVVALVVLGPTRLPGLVRKVGRWIGKARAMARDFREQLESEVNVEELNRAAKKHLNLEDNPFVPPSPAEATAAAGVAAGAAGVVAGSTPGSVDTLADDPTHDLTYPYGTPTAMSSSSADPHVVPRSPQPGDDDYSHAHAAGAEPEPWSPEAEHASPSHAGSMQAELALDGAAVTQSHADGPDKQVT